MTRPRAATLSCVALMLFCIALSSHAQAVASARAQQSSSAVVPDDTARGIKLYEQGETEEAIKVLTKVVKKSQNDADAWYHLGLAYNREGRLAAAHPAFQKTVDLRPQFAAARAHLAYALLLANSIDRAAEEATYAISLGGQNAQTHYVVGEVALRRKEYEKALKKADDSLELDHGYSSALILKSLALLGLERKQESAEALEQLLSLKTTDSISEWRGQLEELRQAVDKKPDQRTDISGPIVKGSEVTTKVRLSSKPEPPYTEKARQAGVEGTVVLSVIFSSDATLKRVLVLQWLPFGLAQRAVEAARRIKFTPATKDGQPVSMYYKIEYNFHLY
jgi:TonB family protein